MILEINNNIGGSTADKIKYDNSTSGLESDNIQGAVDELNDSLNTVDLLLSQTTTAETTITIPSLSEYRSLLIVNIVASGNVTCIMEIPISLLKKNPNMQFWCDASNNSNRSYVKYISDTSIGIYTICAKVEIYGK